MHIITRQVLADTAWEMAIPGRCRQEPDTARKTETTLLTDRPMQPEEAILYRWEAVTRRRTAVMRVMAYRMQLFRADTRGREPGNMQATAHETESVFR